MNTNKTLVIVCFLIIAAVAGVAVYFVMKGKEDIIKSSFSGAYIPLDKESGTDNLGGKEWKPGQQA
ncbi:MAG: hypothetical protein EOL95_09885 [Bacteroidia bacterium]|nr:hypothetical protein [Bacteroidia bacterium]